MRRTNFTKVTTCQGYFSRRNRGINLNSPITINEIQLKIFPQKKKKKHFRSKRLKKTELSQAFREKVKPISNKFSQKREEAEKLPTHILRPALS